MVDKKIMCAWCKILINNNKDAIKKHCETKKHKNNYFRERKGAGNCKHPEWKIVHGVFNNFEECTVCGKTHGYKKAFLQKDDIL